MIKDLSMIACISADRGLGLNNQLLWNIPADMQFFRTTTTGHPVVMGSRTYESIGRPLPGRENIILSRQALTVPDQVKVFADLDALKAYLSSLPGEKFIIGGASLYRLFLPEAATLYLTEVAATVPADVFFPEFDPADYQRSVLQSGVIDRSAASRAVAEQLAAGQPAADRSAADRSAAGRSAAEAGPVDNIQYDVVKYTHVSL